MKRLAPLLLAVLFAAGCASAYVTKDEVASLHQGMTEREVVQRIGKPNDINRTNYGTYERAQFVYHITTYERAYVYFENGRLTSIQY